MSIASQVFDGLAAAERGYSLLQSSRFTLAEGVENRPTELTLVTAAWEMCEPELLRDTALVFVTPEMVDLLRHASTTLTPYSYNPSVLPWPAAFVVGAKPFLERTVPLSVIQWSTAKPAGEVEGWEPGACIASVLERKTSVSGLSNVLVPYHAIWLPPGFNPATIENLDTTVTEEEAQAATDAYARILCTLWLLLQQRVAIQRKAIPQRGERRRWIRAEQGPLPDVTIVELRRPLNTEPFKGESGFVDWSHRWIVDGHWRNQYHPSTQEHVPTWIAPYVKGPDDKPLVVSRKVHAWTR